MKAGSDQGRLPGEEPDRTPAGVFGAAEGEEAVRVEFNGIELLVHLHRQRPCALESDRWSTPLTVHGLHRRLCDEHGYETPYAIHLACAVFDRMAEALVRQGNASSGD